MHPDLLNEIHKLVGNKTFSGWLTADVVNEYVKLKVLEANQETKCNDFGFASIYYTEIILKSMAVENPRRKFRDEKRRSEKESAYASAPPPAFHVNMV